MTPRQIPHSASRWFLARANGRWHLLEKAPSSDFVSACGKVRATPSTPYVESDSSPANACRPCAGYWKRVVDDMA